MTTLEIARIAEARAAGKGWSARCPAHADRSPSLSIREGRNGRTLVRCFAGCSPQAIAAALGLKLSDLFADAWNPDRGSRRAVRSVDVEDALQCELAHIVAREGELTGLAVRELARHRNEARSTIERRFSVRLKREPSPWHEIEPYAADPAWLACVDQALNVEAARGGLMIGFLRRAVAHLPMTQLRVLRYARKLLRSLGGVAA